MQIMQTNFFEELMQTNLSSTNSQHIFSSI
jgi:hypothetical protein